MKIIIAWIKNIPCLILEGPAALETCCWGSGTGVASLSIIICVSRPTGTGGDVGTGCEVEGSRLASGNAIWNEINSI